MVLEEIQFCVRVTCLLSFNLFHNLLQIGKKNYTDSGLAITLMLHDICYIVMFHSRDGNWYLVKFCTSLAVQYIAYDHDSESHKY